MAISKGGREVRESKRGKEGGRMEKREVREERRDKESEREHGNLCEQTQDIP